jgi:hypothetical protein
LARSNAKRDGEKNRRGSFKKKMNMRGKKSNERECAEMKSIDFKT